MASRDRELIAGAPVLVAATVGLVFCVGTLVISCFSFFIVPLSHEFGWTRGAVSMGLAVASLGLAIAAPVHGLLIDRIGPRRPILFSIVGLSVALASLYWLTASLAHLCLCFAAMTLLGASASPIGYSRVLIGAFDRQRGLALGIALSGVGLGAFLLPLCLQLILDTYGWRICYLALAVAALVPLPLCAWAFRDQGPSPIKIGLTPAETVGPVAGAARTFLLLAFSFFLLGLVTVGLGAHLVPLLTDNGISSRGAAAAVMLVGLTIIVSRTGIGWLIDHFNAPFVLAMVTLALALACLILALPMTMFSVAIAAILLGIGLGAEMDIMSFLISRYWPARSFGRTYGLLFGLFSIGSAAGPIFLGVMFDRFGGYQAALVTAALLSVTIAAVCLFLPRYAGRPVPTPA